MMADTHKDTTKKTPSTDVAREHHGARRNRSLDGLAGLAIVGVLGYALGLPILPGGHLGLVMLLTIAGYVLTSAQLKRVRRGIAAIPALWRRDLARLWPPMAIVCALTALVCLIFQRPLLEAARPDALPSLALVENLSCIFRGVAPLGAAGAPSPVSPFAHLWFASLAAQLCLIWPPVMQLAYAALPTKRHARRLTLALALVSAIGMGLAFWDGSGLARAFFGTDTRAFAPLLGAWLAYAIPLDGHPSRDVRTLAQKLRPAIEVAGIFSLAALATCMHDLPVDSALLYRGGMLAASLLTLAVIATVVLPGGLVTTLLSLRPLRWLGARSINIYLWHLPIFCLCGIGAGAPWWVAIAAVAITLLAAEATTRVLGILSRIRMPEGVAERPRVMIHRPAVLASSLAAGILALALVGAAGGPSLSFAPANDGAQQAAEAQADQQQSQEEVQEAAQPEGGEAAAEQPADDAGDAQPQEAKKDEPLRIMLIGNSFTYYNSLGAKLKDITHADVVEQTKGAAHISDHLDASSELGAKTQAALDKGPWDYVVIQEMSTTPMDERDRYLADVQKMCDLVREKGATPIIYATWAYKGTKWGADAHNMSIDDMNAALQATFDEAGKATGAPVANVGGTFAEKGFDQSLFAPDGKHPSDQGTRVAAEVIAKTIEDTESAKQA